MLFILSVQHSGTLLNGNPKAEDIPITICHKAINQNLDRTITKSESDNELDSMGSAGFEPAASSARGWHHTKLDNDP
jgi:hypothetical protein